MLVSGPCLPLTPHPTTRMVTTFSFLPPRFPELESPRLSKILRTGAFAYPFLFDNLPLFYRVRGPGAPYFPVPVSYTHLRAHET